jgi:hypothetical protein
MKKSIVFLISSVLFAFTLSYGQTSEKAKFVKTISISPLPEGFNPHGAFSADYPRKAIAHFVKDTAFEGNVYAKMKKVKKSQKVISLAVYQTSDSASLSEIACGKKNLRPMSIKKLTQAMACLISQQRTGGVGELTNRNVFFVKLAPDKLVGVHALWFPDLKKWFLYEYPAKQELLAGVQMFFLSKGPKI